LTDTPTIGWDAPKQIEKFTMQPEERIPGPEWETPFIEAYRLPIDIALHGILLAVAISPFVYLYRKRKAASGWLDLWCLILAAAIVPLGAGTLGSVLPKHFMVFLVGYTLLSLAALLLSMLIVAIRMKRQSKGSYALGLLATLGLLALLVGLMLPAVPSAREAARRMACSNQIRQLGLLLIPARDRNESVDLSRNPAPRAKSPEQWMRTAPGEPPRSWRVQILPELEYGWVRKLYNDAEAWDSPTNIKVAQIPVAPFTCPSEPNLVSPAHGGRFTSYALLRLAEKDSDRERNAYRILLIESCGANIVWSEPRDVDANTYEPAILSRSKGPNPFEVNRKPWKSKGIGSSFHGSGTHAVFGDGSTRFLPASLDQAIVSKMIDGEDWGVEALE
jgi:hypothetical protein